MASVSPAEMQQTVTASELVRQFGIWQDVATRSPVYILHRGRARLVLTSVELMSALCAPHAGGLAQHEARERALLDSVHEPTLIVDADLQLRAVGRAARGYFGAAAVEGAPLSAILPADSAPFVTGAVRRAIDSGIGEVADLRTGPHRGRRLELSIDPHPVGALIIGRDRSVEDDRDDALSAEAALRSAVAALPGLAVGEVGLRGYVAQADTSLGDLTGIAAAGLIGVRFVTLFELGSRVALGDTIEAVLADGVPRRVAARLLVNRGDPRAVQVAFSAQRRGPAITGLLAAVAPEQG